MNIVTCVTPGTPNDRALLGLLGEGERVSKQFAGKHVVIAPASAAEILDVAKQFADRIVAVSDSAFQDYQPETCLSILAKLCSDLEAQFVLLGQDTYSQELSARLGARLGGCSIGDAQSLEFVEGKAQAKRSVYGGKAIAVVQANKTPAVIGLRSRAFEPSAPRETIAEVETTEVQSDRSAESDKVVITDRQREESTGVKLEDAQVIVSGGRGLGGPEPFQELEQLADAISGQVAASRAACDSGWVPPGYQVGQTGKKVAPELYLAIAISGASQHLMGISDAKVVAAINTDPEAPIFKRAQFGLVEDWKTAIGPLREKLAELKG